MEQLFAVRVLVHYHDKTNVDHAAVRRLLRTATVDSLMLLLADGDTVSLSTYIQTNPSQRKPIVEVVDSSGSALTQVASVFMLAEARAAADALPSSPHELETACSALERLLGCLTTKRPLLPVRDIKQSARVKLGSAARRRAVHRLSRSGSSVDNISILRAVNAILRLCDVATHCLAVVSRQSVSSKLSCEMAVSLSTRLLTLAASLYEVQKVDVAPALSFFSSNSLRTALVAGAMHLGVIAVEHREIEPMPWIHVANRIVMSSGTTAAPKTSVLSALFGGMVKAAKRYEESERDTRASEGALCLLSTLHVILETDTAREAMNRDENTSTHARQVQASKQSLPTTINPSSSLGSGAISQAARSFLGERVVAAEEDGDEGRIAARTVYQACEEYAERAGENDGIMGLLQRLFSSAGAQSRLEAVDEPIVFLSEANLSLQPEESDASSEGSHIRPESPPFLMDVFDQRSNSGFAASATVGSTSEAGADHADRIELHREIGALALDTLAHWVSRPETFARYPDLDMITFTLNICKSASFFSVGNTSASYDLRAAMIDFGALLSPILVREVRDSPSSDGTNMWASLVESLVVSCPRMNPILRSVLSCNKSRTISDALLRAFLEGYREEENPACKGAEPGGGLPPDSLLNMLLFLMTEENAVSIIEGLADDLKNQGEQRLSESSLLHRASCVTLLSNAIFVSLGMSGSINSARIQFAAMYRRDVDNAYDPVFPQHLVENEALNISRVTKPPPKRILWRLINAFDGISSRLDRLCFQSTQGSWETLAKKASVPQSRPLRSAGTKSTRDGVLLYHMFRSCALLHRSLSTFADTYQLRFSDFFALGNDSSQLPLCSPFVSMKALESAAIRMQVSKYLSERKQGSLPLLYTAECLLLAHPGRTKLLDRQEQFAEISLESLVESMIRNVVAIASDCTLDDISCNMSALQKAFRTDFQIDMCESKCSGPRQYFETELPRDQISLAYLQLALDYTRSGMNQISELLGNAVTCAKSVLPCLSSTALLQIRNLIFDVAEILLYLPNNFACLTQACASFLKDLLGLAFPNLMKEGKDIRDAVLFVSRVRGFQRMLRLGYESASAMHLICKFAKESSMDSSFETSALEASLSLQERSLEYCADFCLFLRSHSPPLSISPILDILLAPKDESAVAVSAHAQSLSYLIEACESSKDWQVVVLNGLEDLFSSETDDFPARLVRRSVMQSVTLNTVIVQFVERVVGQGSGILSMQLLRKAFAATQLLFEHGKETSVENRARLLNFATRTAICDGILSRKIGQNSSLMEHELPQMIITSLDGITTQLGRDADLDTKHIVHCLCALLECYLIGVYGKNNQADTGITSKPCSPSPTNGDDDTKKAEKDNPQGSKKEITDSEVPNGSPSSNDQDRALCTFTTTGTQFVEQHWYFCYTCDLAGSEGVCSVCARTCHADCEVSYSKHGRFFCDCGARSDPYQENASNAMSASEDGDDGGSNNHDTPTQSVQSHGRKPCRSLRTSAETKAKRVKDMSQSHESIGYPSAWEVLGDLKLRDSLISELQSSNNISSFVNDETSGQSSIQKAFESITKSKTNVEALVRSGTRLIAELDDANVVSLHSNSVQDLSKVQPQLAKLLARDDVISSVIPAKLLNTCKVHRAGSIDMGGALQSFGYSILESLISFSPDRGIVAIAQKSGFIEFLETSGFLKDDVDDIAKTFAADYAGLSVFFNIVCLEFHPTNGNILLVVGKENVSVMCRTLKDGMWGWSKTKVELGLTEFEGSNEKNILLSAQWLEDRTASILVVTTKFVKVFNVEDDCFSPSFFAAITQSSNDQSDVAESKVQSPTDGKAVQHRREIKSACVVARVSEGLLDVGILIFALTSDGKIFITSSEDDNNQEFSCFIDLRPFLEKEGAPQNPFCLSYNSTSSVLAISFENGSLLLLSLAISLIQGSLLGSIRWCKLFKEALPSGNRTQIRSIPGPDLCYIFFQPGQTLNAGGLFHITQNLSMELHLMGGSPAASVSGATYFAASSILGKPDRRGCVVVLDDGSLHRSFYVRDHPRYQVSEQSILLELMEQQRLRTMNYKEGSNQDYHSFNTVPDHIGFFEKCRPVSDHISIEVTGDRKHESRYERMAITLASGGGDCVVSPKEKEPFKFVAEVENDSIVLVGARLRFGGTERSRYSVPSDVKVFNRMVRWKSKNGAKRWLDIPFATRESIASPRKVSFELFPRRSVGDSRSSGDGYVAVDALELFAVSSIEFTERKLTYENEKKKHFEEMKKRKDTATLDKWLPKGTNEEEKTNSLMLLSNNATRTQGQTAILTILLSIDTTRFVSENGSADLLHTVSNLWSASFKGSPSRDPKFLEQLLKPCLALCADPGDTDNCATPNEGAADLLLNAPRATITGLVDAFSNDGPAVHIGSLERALFAFSGVARSLITAGCAAKSFESDSWALAAKATLPSVIEVSSLFMAFLNLGFYGRTLCRASHTACQNIADIYVAYALQHHLQSDGTENAVEVFKVTQLFVNMLCSLDQNLRLFLSQRLAELFDSPATAIERTRSPFEYIMARAFLKRISGHDGTKDSSSSETEGQDENDDTDGSQRWAYRCDVCGEVCDQEWWHCVECEDFDLCTTCLRKPNISFKGNHTEEHMMIRRTSNDEMADQEDGEICEKLFSHAVLAVQQVLRPVIDGFLQELKANRDVRSSWRLLDCAEMIAQTLRSRCPSGLRAHRLRVLFNSSFPSVLGEVCKDYGKELSTSVEDSAVRTTIPGSAYSLLILLRLLICARGSVTPALIHSCDIPRLLFILLSHMHTYLRMVSEAVVTSGGLPSPNPSPDDDILSWNKWNEPISSPTMSNELLSAGSSLGGTEEKNEIFEVNQELGNAGSMFLNLVNVTLQVLEYSFKSTASSRISSQMKEAPRDVFCDIINFCKSASSEMEDCRLFKRCEHSATLVLSVLSFEHKDELNNTLHKHLYKEQSKTLERAISTGKVPLNDIHGHKKAVEIASIIGVLQRSAMKHPTIWRDFSVEHGEVLLNVLTVAKEFQGQIRTEALQLMSIGLCTSSEIAKKVAKGVSLPEIVEQMPKTAADTEDRHDSGKSVGEVASGLMELIASSRNEEQVDLFVYERNNHDLLYFLTNEILLKALVPKARIAASYILTFGIVRAVHKNNTSLLDRIHRRLMKGLELMPYAGELADSFVQCLQFYVKCCQFDIFGSGSEGLLTSVAHSISESLRNRCELLISHPNARVYGRLSAFVDINGYYLESDPCMTCSASTCELSEVKECRLDTIRADTRYTDCSIMHRLISPHELSSISLKVIDPRRTRKAKTIEVSYSSRTVSDAAELKNPEHPWRRLTNLELGPSSTESCVDLLVPIPIANMKFEFVDFHYLPEPSSNSRGSGDGENMGNGRRTNNGSRPGEVLQCPRCSRPVTDRHGICHNCHENAYQCRQCRNINYENLDGFLCNECGYCKHARFEFSISGRPTFIAERILNEEDRIRASKLIEKETRNVHRSMEQLTKLRTSLIRSLNSGRPNEEPRERSRLLQGRVGLADILDSVAPRSEIAVLEALLEQSHAPQEIEETANSTQGGISVTEEVIAENGDRDQNNAAGSSVTSPINRNSRQEQSKSQNSGGAVNRNVTGLASLYSKECRSAYVSMSKGIRVLTLTRAELVKYANRVGGSRLRYANEIASQGAPASSSSSKNVLNGHGSGGLPMDNRSDACYGCTQAFISKCVSLVETLLKKESPAASSIRDSDLVKDIMFACSLSEKSEVRRNIKNLITILVKDNHHATRLVCTELARKIEFCVDSFATIDSHSVAKFEMAILESTASLDDACWEERLRLVTRILFKASKHALRCSSVSESIILPCLRVALRLMNDGNERGFNESTTAADTRNGLDNTSNAGVPTHVSQSTDADTVDMSEVMNPDSSRSRGDADISSEASEELSRQDSGRESTLGSAINALVDLQYLVDLDRGSGRQQSTRRSGSDVFPGSGAPSSSETPHEASIPDEVSSVGTTEHGIDVLAIQELVENDHDSKLLSVDVNKWLRGEINQNSWIAGMRERAEAGKKEKSTVRGEPQSSQKVILRAFFRKWRYGSVGGASPYAKISSSTTSHIRKLSIEKDNWVVRLMLLTPCTTVRKEACSLLEVICGQEETLRLQLLDVLTGSALSLGADAGEKSKEFFDLLDKTISSPRHRLYLIAKGFLPKIATLIRTRAERLLLSEANSEASFKVVNFLEGYALKRLISVLTQTLSAVPSQRTSVRDKIFNVQNNQLVWSLQRAYMCVRKLISLRTKLTDDCGSQLCDVLISRDFLFSGSTITAVVSSCVAELKEAERRNDAQAIGILLEELCLMLCPERKDPVCYLSLNKAPTQEEFIRGSMSRNPYPSSSFDGPLMRDVKNKICRDLDLPGLLEDDFGMELIVAGNLVKLDLPIMGVYEHVWKGSSAASMASTMQTTQLSRTFGFRRTSHGGSRAPGGHHRGGSLRNTILAFRRVNSDRDSIDDDNRTEGRTDPPMGIVYRLSGLDGEATEPIVDSLPSKSNDEPDVEELYADTVVFGQVGGLGVLLELLTKVGSWGDDAETAVRAPALRLLRASCQVAQNRALLAQSPDAVRTLLDCAASAFEHSQASATAVASAESLLIAAEQILAQQRKELESCAGDVSDRSDTVSLSSQDPEEVMSRIQVFLGRLSIATSPKAENSILHLLPFLIQGVSGAIDIVLSYFSFDWERIETDHGEQRKAGQLGTILLATPFDLRGDKFVASTIKTGAGKNAVTYIIQHFPLPKIDNRSVWDISLNNEASPLVLKLLTGLSSFLGSGEKQFSAGTLLKVLVQEEANFIPVLCQLEMAVSSNSIGTATEELLDSLAKDEGIETEISAERAKIKKARKEAAKRSRMNILRQAGLSKSSEEVSNPSAQGSDSSNTKDVKASEGQVAESRSVTQLLEEVPDEVGPACVVCGDGFMCRPEEALAFYVYCRRVPLDLNFSSAGGSKNEDSDMNADNGDEDSEIEIISSNRNRIGGSSRSGSNTCYTTVTQLNAIHLSCHKEAARVDRTSRRDEWDGAFLRNSQTKCNNMFPVRPPVCCVLDKSGVDEVALRQAKMSFKSAVDSYTSRLSSLGRSSVGQSKAVTYDIGRSLLRFAEGKASAFSEHSKGGGAHSNACLLPSMIGLGIYMLEQGEGWDEKQVNTLNATLEKYLREDEEGDVTYYLGSALMVCDMKKWDEMVCAILKKALGSGLQRAKVLRLVCVSDLANRILKRRLVVNNGEEWLANLRDWIGRDEAFVLRFGDELSERWEHYVRDVKDDASFLKAMERNQEVQGVEPNREEKDGDSPEVNMKIIEELDKVLELIK